MLQVLVDGNNFFIKNLFSYKSGMRKSERLFENEQQLLEYSHVISNSIMALIEKFDSRIGLVICFDYKTWRKQYYPEYKAHREYDDTINWDAYFKFVEDYAQKLQTQHNIRISRIEGAEADDLIYLWSRKLNNNGYDVLIVSEDKDLHQLVNNTKNGKFTTVYNNNFKTPKMYRHHLTDLAEDAVEVDVFNASDALSSSRRALVSLINDVTTVDSIDNVEFLIKKILLGDDGDNVPSVYTWVDKNERKKRITPTIADKIYKNFVVINENILYMLYNDFPFFAKALCDSIKFIVPAKGADQEILDNIERNCKLMCLHYSFIPKEIVKKFKEQYGDENGPVFERSTFLSGTKYYQDPRSNNKNNRFDSYFSAFGD